MKKKIFKGKAANLHIGEAGTKKYFCMKNYLNNHQNDCKLINTLFDSAVLKYTIGEYLFYIIFLHRLHVEVH